MDEITWVTEMCKRILILSGKIKILNYYNYYFWLLFWQIELALIKIIQSVSNLILQTFSCMSTEKTFHLAESSMSSKIRAVISGASQLCYLPDPHQVLLSQDSSSSSSHNSRPDSDTPPPPRPNCQLAYSWLTPAPTYLLSTHSLVSRTTRQNCSITLKNSCHSKLFKRSFFWQIKNKTI